MKRFFVVTIVFFVILIVTFAFGYETTVEASGADYNRAYNRALEEAISNLSKMIYVKVSEEIEQSVYQSTGKKREETYKKQLKLKTKLILEGYEVKILKKWKEGTVCWITLKVSIPPDKVKLILRNAVVIERAFSLYEEGFLDTAKKVLEDNKIYLDQIAGYSIERDKLKLLIDKKEIKLRKLYDEAMQNYEEGRIRFILEAYVIINKEWKDFPYMDELKKIMSEIQKNLKVKISWNPEYLLIGSTTRLIVSILYKDALLNDNSEVFLKTPEKTVKVLAEGEKIYLEVTPSFITPRYNVDVYVSEYKMKSIAKPVRVLPEYDSLRACYLKVSRENYSMVKVNEKIEVNLRTVPGIWIYIFDYKEMTGTMKEIFSMRMVGNGELTFPISFDAPSEGFYEGMIVVFSKDRMKDISDGAVYTVDEIRNILSKMEHVCEKEILFTVTE